MPDIPDRSNRPLTLVSARVIREDYIDQQVHRVLLVFDETVSGKRVICELPIARITDIP